MNKLLFAALLVIAISSLKFKSHSCEYRILVSRLPKSITDDLTFTIDDSHISFRGCNYHFG